MKARGTLMLTLCGALSLPGQSLAFSLIVLYQGPVDDREVYFADVRTILNRTPPEMVGSGTEIREVPVTAVYENAMKPEFVHMKLQFRCPDGFSLSKAESSTAGDAPRLRAGGPVTFRIGPNSYQLRRSDLQTEPVTVSDWQTSSAPMLSRTGTIACNDIEIDQALHAAIRKADFDFDGFGKRIAKLGLPRDMALIGETLPSEYLEFAWENLWWSKVLDGKRPDPTGRWSTPLSEADRQAAMAKLRQKQNELESGTAAARASLIEGIRRTDAEVKSDLEAARNAGKHPDGSKMNKYEAKLAKVFQGRREQEVVDVMGNPDGFNQVAATRFLRYSAWWEQQGVTVYGAQGVIGGDPGGYAECHAEFSIRQDAGGEWRVDDIRVRGDYEGERGSTRLRNVCDDAARPRR